MNEQNLKQIFQDNADGEVDLWPYENKLVPALTESKFIEVAMGLLAPTAVGDVVSALSAIPLDLEGSNISYEAWLPDESNKKYMGEDGFNEAVKEYYENSGKVLFKNVTLGWDTCDCGGGYPCSHGRFVYEINIKNGDENHTLDLDGEGISAYNNGKQATIPEKDVTAYDFYRMCEMVGIKLELTDYALSLITTTTATEIKGDGWVSVEDAMPSDKWSDSDTRYDHISGQQLVAVDNGSVGCAAYDRIKKVWFIGGLTKECGNIEFDRTKVTHWKPKPKPPLKK
jgi:hypothetical protein